VNQFLKEYQYIAIDRAGLVVCRELYDFVKQLYITVGKRFFGK
jgi:hypothetical protein